MQPFAEIRQQVLALLQRETRVAYRMLKRLFSLDDEDLEDLKADLIDAKRLAMDEDGKVLVWVGERKGGEEEQRQTIPPPDSGTDRRGDSRQTDSRRSEAERRQLTVLFCDLVDSTVLSERLDPEELREVVQAYHAMCTEAITLYAGYTAQHLGDGLLVYFGYPAAHEDEAARAVRTALGIVAGLQSLNARLQPTIKARLPHPLQVRMGVHTRVVVIGEIGSSEKREMLALGETPNLAARLQGVAEPDTVVISQATQRLVQGLFECQDLGPQPLKGLSTPVAVYQIMGESADQSRFAAATQKGLTPLVGRAEELALLRQRWAQAKGGTGQVVLLSGEPGIGKSRLVQELKEQLTAEGATRIEFQCSPYHQNSALYPLLDHMQRLLQFVREDTPTTKLEKLQQVLARYRFPQAETFPLLAALLSLPHPEGHPSVVGSPQKQKEKTHAALVAWLVEEAEKTAVLCAWEDLHWADPSTVEVLTLLLEQIPMTRLLTLLTSRPEFTAPWGSRSYLTQLTLSRLEKPQIEAMIGKVAAGTPLPAEIVKQIRLKTDGVPLFVEELTKNVVEQHGGAIPEASLPLGVPSTLQDALMARLDRLGAAKEIAQLGATLGREFTYELLHAVSPLDEDRLRQGLRQLIEAELIYQRGLPPQATYLFKHALIQDTAYQSLLKSKRQQLHQQIAQVLEEQFPDMKETQPELLAHHYTEAGLTEQAIPYWQKAGQRASQRSAHLEAISHFTKGLGLLKTLLDTSERAQQALTLQLALGGALVVVRGFAAPEVEKAYARAQELCRQVGETPQLFSVLHGLRAFYVARAEYKVAHKLGKQLLSLAQNLQDPTLLLPAHQGLGSCLWFLGEQLLARDHFEQGVALYDPRKHRLLASLYGNDLGVYCYAVGASVLWGLGYLDQALKRTHESLDLARKLSHPYTLAYTLYHAALFHSFRKEGKITRELAEEAILLSTNHGFSLISAWAMIVRGWALAEQGQKEIGMAQMRSSLATFRASGAGVGLSHYLALLAEAHGKAEQPAEGLSVLSEALAIIRHTEERPFEPELYRIKGELTLQAKASHGQVEDKSQTSRNTSEIPNAHHRAPSTQTEAETCFLKAIEIAQKQQAKFWELRATMSLARLWRSQGKKAEAHPLLSEIYHWFTEGFDTKDLQEAKTLLEELSYSGC